MLQPKPIVNENVARTIRNWRQDVEWDRKGIHLSSTLLALWTFYLGEPIATASWGLD